MAWSSARILTGALPAPLRWLAGRSPGARGPQLCRRACARSTSAGLGRDRATRWWCWCRWRVCADGARRSPGITLEDKQQVTRHLLACGRRHPRAQHRAKAPFAVKGGRLAAACRGPVIAWLLSDVVGDDPAVIGSGPTVADRSTFADALAILDRHGGRARFPEAVVAHLERGAAGLEEETPKPGSAVFGARRRA